ncbi:MAG: hypothetical protein LBG77_08640 [Dysgonamonadaceae bacterium]|nr:hypothetical protein [Dysgonamonadaceae bacterium]
MQQQQEMRFCLTASLQQVFNTYFAQAKIQFLALYGDDYIASVRRLVLITFCISVIFTVLQLMQSQRFAMPLICSDINFNTALEMVKILVQHAAKVFDALPADSVSPQTNNLRLALWQALPQQFDRPKYIEVATQL